MLANVTLIGRMGEPNLRFTPQGKAVCAFGVVTDRSYKDNNGEWQNVDTTWYNCVAWEKLGEEVAENLQKGDAVIVYGQLVDASYERDGGKVNKMEVKVTAIGLDLKWGSKRRESGSSSGGGFSDEPPF